MDAFLHCFVTGASGYLGSALCSKLIADDVEVTGQVYQGSAPAATRVIRADLRQGISAQHLAGVDVVFHLAGVAHQNADSTLYQDLNVQASLALAKAAKAAGVRRFVFVSSVLAARAEQGQLAGVSAYALSKAQAEHELKAVFLDSSTALVIIRPALIYSAEAPGHLGWLRRWAKLRLPPPPDRGGRSMISRVDLVDLLTVVAGKTSASTTTIVASDGEEYSSRRIYQAFANSLDVAPPIKHLPVGVWKLACLCLDWALSKENGQFWRRMSEREPYPPVGMDELGFKPIHALETALECEQ